MGNMINHLGIIMDGNRRWAKKHALQSVLDGHRSGAYKLIDTCEWCIDLGIRNLTVYAFSTENFKRSEFEVSGLFKIMDDFFAEQLGRCLKDDIRVYIVGDRELLGPAQLKTVNNAEKATEQCKTLNLYIALSYGGRDEIVQGTKVLCEKVKSGEISIDDITEETLKASMYCADMPDMEMVIRTGGQKRLSNFFPWLTVYSELYFIDALWPDFSREMLEDALKYYEKVQINVGK